MLTIISYIRTHFKQDFKALTYILVFLFLGLFIYVNHTTNLPTLFFKNHQKGVTTYIYYFLFFGFAYYTTIIITAITKSDWSFTKSFYFWFTSIIAILLISFRFGFLEFLNWIQKNIDPQKAHFYIKAIARSTRFIIFTFGILFFYYLFEKNNTNYYGLSTKNTHWKSYFLLLLFVLPFIIVASFQPSFLKQYPMLGNVGSAINKWTALAIYEPIYLIDFIAIEWFFRGFLILGTVKYLGSKAVLPMVVLYAFFHIGKPTGEIIGSVFGGYILGIVSLHSRSIIGGIIIHMGVAFLMDLFAVIQKLDNYL
ncbi:CPBP family glutamic-type intramembrane protease [Tenacibaculum haliotis]|uniref:CPBP family glutamic-type intramembrane protease n=1 Tax=Tenacibaculum haliotis TaxID=1888914 RepID=UPI0021B044C4|nr:CPBP family glutamic-type intramembrane protease [Tenacibaculum haliotis]MCT4699432.1 hypothetical protein [Tenacibaculum haliotis]